MVMLWHRLSGVRLRSALAAAAVVGVAGAVAAVVFILTAQASLIRNVDAAAAARADEVVSVLHDNDDPDLEDTLRPGTGDRTEVQVLSPAGVVLASTSGTAHPSAMTSLRPTAGHSGR